MNLDVAPIAHRKLAFLCTIASLAAIGTLTLLPSAETVPDGWACVFCSTFASADAILNIILYLPLGIGLKGMRFSFRRSIAFGLLLSFTIELAQLLVVSGRSATMGDVLANVVGLSIGYALTYYIRSLVWPSKIEAKRAIAFYTPILLVVVLGTGYLLKPSFPNSVYYGQWTPELGHLERYDGRVLDVRLGSQFLPSHRLLNSGSLGSLWTTGMPLSVHAIAGARTSGLASLFSIYDEQQREVILIGPDRDDLVFRYRTRAMNWRLHQPVFRFEGVFDSIEIGDTLTVAAITEGEELCLWFNSQTRCGFRFSSGAGWTLLLKSESFSQSTSTLLNGVWIFLLLLPIGFWMRTSFTTMLVGFGVFVSLGVGPLVFYQAPFGLAEWIGTGIGFGTGLLLSRRLSKLSQQ